MCPKKCRFAGFTLIELLVVVAIIALLVSILIPALNRARFQARLVVCGTHQRQLGVGFQMYADRDQGLIPRGPDVQNPFQFFYDDDFSSNLIWIGDTGGDPQPKQYNGVGMLLEPRLIQDEVLFCPGDNQSNLDEELPKIVACRRGGANCEDAYGSYTYRQLDHLSERAKAGRIDALGENIVDDQVVQVRSLLLDTNSLGEGPSRHTNHKGEYANVLYIDGSVTRFENEDDALAIPAEAFIDFSKLTFYVDQMLNNADYSYIAAPWKAPRLQILNQ